MTKSRAGGEGRAAGEAVVAREVSQEVTHGGSRLSWLSQRAPEQYSGQPQPQGSLTRGGEDRMQASLWP